MKKTTTTTKLLGNIRKFLTQREIAGYFGVALRTVQRWESGETVPYRYISTAIQQMINKSRASFPCNEGEFTFIDLFAGIGGIRLGFEKNGGRCIFTCEYDRYCEKTYRTNFSVDHPFAGDITKISEKNIPPHDVLLAGFPCQPFSIAGVTKKQSLGLPHGFACKTQGTLFFDVVRILAHHRPKVFLLENVKNLQNHNGGRTFEIIMKTLIDELNYNVFFKVIDARGFVPQHRERIYIVGFRDKTDFSWSLMKLPDPSSRKMKEILHPEDGSEEPEFPYTIGEKARVNNKYILSDHLWKYLQQYAKKHRARGNGFGFGLVGRNDVARTLSARYYKDGSEILIERKGNPRRLTLRECARLMGFDSNGTRFKIPVSDTQAYKQFGNSVVVPVVQEISRIMKPYILS